MIRLPVYLEEPSEWMQFAASLGCGADAPDLFPKDIFSGALEIKRRIPEIHSSVELT